MKTFRQDGKHQTLTAPSGGVVSGGAYLIGSVLAIAEEDAAAGDPFTALLVGVVRVPKPPDEVWTEGLKIYFDESESLFTLDDDTAANPLVGVAVPPIAAADVEITSDALEADLTIDGLTVTVLDYTGLTGKTITVKVGGVSTDLVEGTDFDAETGNNTTAGNIADAIDTVEGAEGTAASAVVTVVAGTGSTDQAPGTGTVRIDGAAR